MSEVTKNEYEKVIEKIREEEIEQGVKVSSISEVRLTENCKRVLGEVQKISAKKIEGNEKAIAFVKGMYEHLTFELIEVGEIIETTAKMGEVTKEPVKLKCKDCRFAITSEVGIPIGMLKSESKLRLAEEEMVEKGGIVCTGDLRHVSQKDSEKDIEDCEMYKKGIEMFGEDVR